MNIKELNKDIKKSFLSEYIRNVRKTNFAKSLFTVGKTFVIGSVIAGVVGITAGLGAGLFGAYGLAHTVTMTGLSMLGTSFAALGVTEAVRGLGVLVAKKKLNNDAKTPALLDRYKSEIIPKRKRILRAQASEQIKAFEAKRAARRDVYTAFDNVVALDGADYTAAFNAKNLRNTDVAKVVQKSTPAPVVKQNTP